VAISFKGTFNVWLFRCRRWLGLRRYADIDIVLAPLERQFPDHFAQGNESSRERIGQGPVGRFAAGSELAWERKAAVTSCILVLFQWLVVGNVSTMALMEKFFDVHRTGFNFFDRYFQNAMLEMQAMDAEMARMRNQMFQLFPHNPEGGALDTDMQPRVPVVEEHGESKLKLEFNVKDFRPDEVKVKILGNNILQVFIVIYRAVASTRVLKYGTTRVVNYSSNFLPLEYSLIFISGCKFPFSVAVFCSQLTISPPFGAMCCPCGAKNLKICI